MDGLLMVSRAILAFHWESSMTDKRSDEIVDLMMRNPRNIPRSM